MKTFSFSVKCNTATELMEALLNAYNRINREAEAVDKMRVDNGFAHFGTIPEWDLTRIE